MTSTTITRSTEPTGEERFDATITIPLCGHTDSIEGLYSVNDCLDWIRMVMGMHGKYVNCWE